MTVKKCVKTRLLLDKNFENYRPAPTYLLTAPNGATMIWRLNIGPTFRDFLLECQATIEEVDEKRIPRTIWLGKITCTQPESRILEYVSPNKIIAAEKYRLVKAELRRLGYEIIHPVKCIEIEEYFAPCPEISKY